MQPFKPPCTPFLLALLLSSLASAPQAGTLTLRAWGSLFNNEGPRVELRVAGALVGTVQVNSTSVAEYRFEVPALKAGDRVDVVFVNDASGGGQDRNLYVESVSEGGAVVLASSPTALIDRGSGAKAFDGLDTQPGQASMNRNGALRLLWPAAVKPPSTLLAAATRFLAQASFGARPGEAERFGSIAGTVAFSGGPSVWIDQQLRMPVTNDFVNHVQAQYDRGAEFRPGGGSYSLAPITQRFWMSALNSPDQLRKRTAWALHKMWMVSLASGDLYQHGRAYAQYLDLLNRHALGNYRQLMEDMSLSPVMGIYLSHIRNQKEDPATGRLPDENFARELMQLFTIGLHELNPDGSTRLGANNQPIETYTNADVMALAKVFTGYAWGFPDEQLTSQNFRWRGPDYKLNPDPKIDLSPMKVYPAFASTAAVSLFAGKPHAITIPAGTPPAQRLQMALDALFHHPNVGPFVARQLIQSFTSSNPGAAYVQRVASVFANNGKGVRGDLGATVRALLLDPEASQSAQKLREPVLLVAHWARAFQAVSPLGDYRIDGEFNDLGQPVFQAASVFSYFRPGYTPGGTDLARTGRVAPELQIVNESSVAHWANRAESMAGGGLGWSGNQRALVPDYTPLVALLNTGNAMAVVQRLNQLLFAGRMSSALQAACAQAMGTVGGSDAAAQLNRVRVAVYLALSSPEFMVQL